MTKEPVQIIATLGPASGTEAVLAQMLEAGMSAVRLNFSWGTHEEHVGYITVVRTVAARLGLHVPVIQDLSGPRVQKGAEHTFDADTPAFTKKDLNDLVALGPHRPEYVALSYVKDAEDLAELRVVLDEQGLSSKTIAKIERADAVNDLDAIIEAADGIMIARGDLGEAVPMETLPFLKKDILKRCNMAGKPAIVATEMLSSMTEDPDPSRADISDIAQAVLDGASAVMLSAETATGDFPIEAVTVMRRVVDETMRHTDSPIAARF